MTHSLRPLVSISLALPLALLAQSKGKGGVGIKAGAQWANLNASDVTCTGIPGGLGGLYFPVLASTRFEMQPELLISYQGSDLQKADRDPVRMRMLYVQLPLTAKLFLSNEFNLQGGVQAGKCLVATIDDEKATDEFRPYDVGVIAGMGVDLRSGLDVNARYYAGMSAVVQETTGVNPRHRLVQLTLGYRVMRFSHRRYKLNKG